jgi:hypothetical protein
VVDPRVASPADGSVTELYRAPAGAGSVFHALSSDQQLVWAGNSRLVFPAENDGWLHFYSIAVTTQPTSAPARVLTPGHFEIEYAS